ncbi:hypothetical protein [Janthinobacterium sp. AD80]|uniref:hypothetical protein n=1 Tax=Janthinobacterium sp. AD80 TaxID=1528773 RepID=UPI000C8484FE|nr:hypothetical protein [Janthinobacterium sp. AD80]
MLQGDDIGLVSHCLGIGGVVRGGRIGGCQGGGIRLVGRGLRGQRGGGVRVGNYLQGGGIRQRGLRGGAEPWRRPRQQICSAAASL